VRTPVVKKKSKKCIKDENGGLPCIRLHFYVDSCPKQARILNFISLLRYQGFWDDFLSLFFVFGNCWNGGEKLHILLI
jgi:hypothetical protein